METEYKSFLEDLSHLRDEVIAISTQNAEPQYSGGISVEQNVLVLREKQKLLKLNSLNDQRRGSIDFLAFLVYTDTI